MPHLLAVALAIVRQHVDDDGAPARLEHARDLGERALRLRHVVQHQHQRRGIEPGVVDRQRLELAAPKLDVVEPVQPPLRAPAASRRTRRRR